MSWGKTTEICMRLRLIAYEVNYRNLSTGNNIIYGKSTGSSNVLFLRPKSSKYAAHLNMFPTIKTFIYTGSSKKMDGI
jgi:hypothetical protein